MFEKINFLSETSYIINRGSTIVIAVLFVWNIL